MRNQEYWELEYLNNRYMRHLSEQELQERTIDIMDNITTLTEKGQLGLHCSEESGHYWLILWTHIIKEFNLRYGPYPNGFTNGFIKNADIVKPTYPSPPNSKLAIDSIGGIERNQLYKFGRYEHLSKMFKHGIIRISPASSYNDPSLNKAIRDDELSFDINRVTNNVIVLNSKRKTIPSFGVVKFSLKSNTNYYVHCFSSGYNFREYDDFEADACIVIKEPRQFIKNLFKHAKKHLPDYDYFASHVKYLDPLNCEPNDVDLFYCKHFKYSYQNEFRAIWIPKSPTFKLEPIFIEIGSMEKYAKLIRT
ncbi:hypothetical protein [Pectobacterium brasiliense]|uniref:hypothetical protein n=1 Tax=Pectobacterium brasiliense TaxID=180957 RepID=UPI0025A09096|nr:hypothetical protein [Pectobacterium brasiliense]WJM81070.1 hypothetical protein QTI90_23005 [Pectobacterium brasiliense]